MDKPDVDFIEGLSPAVSIDQKSTSKNPRSTVGTITEVYDYLRLLFARAGRPHCPVCGAPIERQTPQQIVDRVLELDEGTRFQVLAPVDPRPQGRVRRAVPPAADPGLLAGPGSTARRSSSPSRRSSRSRRSTPSRSSSTGSRSRRRPSAGSPTRSRPRSASPAGWSSSTSSTCREDDPHRERMFSEQLACPNDHPSTSTSSSRGRSRSTRPFGACPDCTRPRHPDGGRPRAGRPRPAGDARRGRDRSRGPAPTSPTTSCGCSARWASELGLRPEHPVGGPARPRRSKVDPRGPPDARSTCVTRNRYGRERVLLRRASRASSPTSSAGTREAETDTSRERFEGFMREVPCPACRGSRLKPVSLAVTGSGGGKNIAEVCALPIDETAEFLARPRPDRRASGRSPSGCSRRSSERLRLPARRRPRLPLPRPAVGHPVRRRGPAHPAGDPDRRRAWSASSTSSTSRRIGLHQRDNHRLIETLVRLKDLGNTLIVVEHDEDTIETADWVVDIGPGAGEHGGQVVALRHGRGAAEPPRLDHRPVPLRPPRDPGARRSAVRRRRAAS